MSAIQILTEIGDRRDWNERSMLEIACAYIDNQQDEPAFEDHVERVAADEALADEEADLP